MQLRITDYPTLREYVKVFQSGALDIFIIEGSAGAGKSSIVRQSLINNQQEENKHFFWLEGRTTAAALYERLYEHRDQQIIIDDVDGLYRDKECVNILKCLCQTEAEKTVMWNSMTKIRDGRTPTEFKTKSKVCIITNSWKSLNRHVGAVQDRGLLALFHPPAIEIHRYVYDELKHLPGVFDEEIHEFIGKNLGIIVDPSIRHYRNALQLKSAGMPWKEVLVESFGLNDNEMMVLKLQQDVHLSHNQRAAHFAKTLNKSERTYWRVKADLEARGMEFTKES